MPIGAAALALLLGAAAPDPFSGTWRIDLASIRRAPRPDTILIERDAFTCASCRPPFTVRADGTFHPVAGQIDLDEAAVQVVDAATVRRTNRLGGRVVRVETDTLAADGRTATVTFTDTINPGVAPVAGRQVLTRTAPAPAGAHALSGTWQAQPVAQVSDHALTQTLRIEGDRLTFQTGEGFGYTARLDGTPAPTRGDPFIDSVSVRRAGAGTLVEVDRHAGQPVVRFTLTVSPDGSTLSIVQRSEASGRVTTSTAHRLRIGANQASSRED